MTFDKEEWLKSARDMLDFIEANDLIPGIGVSVAKLIWHEDEFGEVLQNTASSDPEISEEDDSRFAKFRFGPHTLLVFVKVEEVA